MSAQSNDTALMVNRDLSKLAPRFADSVKAAIDACNRLGLPAMVYEGYRSLELQALYYKRGRTVKPPMAPVTNAPTNLFSWHGYGLAVDVVHRDLFWKPPGGNAWFAQVAAVFAGHDCNWGGNWTHPDPPHFQWARCAPSPSDKIRDILQTQGLQGVWKALEAIA
ncbi:M15 family metallopeptidase [Variovorax sp. J22R24]|uniref:M15 family metallopeptidase n=1 Tax=Variovorax gracilis TaxID=3053502 RepID=UPI00257880E6|nr:M15 family metallopeptidase [Variovorax sp. J22R24]MDM0104137.1 M15 family metallopeptidase [Variovorax sp. J22R24]